MSNTWRHNLRRLALIGGGLIVLASAAVLTTLLLREPFDDLMKQGRTALERQDYENAAEYARRALARDGTSNDALLLAARTAAAVGRVRECLRYYDKIPDDGSPQAVAARTETGDLYLFGVRNLSAAEAQYRRAVAQDGRDPSARARLAYVLGLQSRASDAVPHRLAVLRSGEFEVDSVYLLSLGERAMEDPATVEPYYREAPHDPAALLGMGRIALEKKRYADAEQMLQRASRSPSHALEAQAWLGRVLLEQGRDEDFMRWQRDLPGQVGSSAPIWTLRGEWAARQSQAEAAVRCFWESARIEPNSARVHYQLGQQLIGLGRPEEAGPFLRRAQQLEQYARAAELAYRVRTTEDFRRAAESAETLGLLWEAWAWALLAPSGAGWSPSMTERLEKTLATSPLERTVLRRNPALALDLSRYPLPDSPPRAAGEQVDIRDVAVDSMRTGARFEDLSAAAGLRFRFRNGGNPASGLVKMYEVTGGGAGVLDYDGDGWPDVYFPQGRAEIANPAGELDRLFQNLGDGRFRDVTGQAQLFEEGFSSGTSVGDYDCDGFPDVYVTNLGPNRLFRNNGDGTFADVTEAAGCAGNEYSVSAAIADLNGDSRPDLYVVNYLAGDDLLERVCGGSDGIPRSCLPHSFPAAADRLYLGNREGQFEDVTSQAGINVPPGKGLGVVAADFAGDGRLSLFVANDVGPNFLFVNTAGRGEFPAFVEQGLPAGVALNGEGRTESGMGTAAGDADGDGRLDLFVTNFEQESNTLYTRLDGLQFTDATAAAGLAQHSLAMVGWGTQFLDGELDGRLDLLITNGHVNNLLDQDKLYRMPPQYLQNVGKGRFSELPADSLGPFFSAQALGRGMARLDWNRDGREDVVISHLDRPAALLTNATGRVGHVLVLRLRGVISDRDAIGSGVTVTVDGKRLERQLTAGDGNQASNERSLVFGLGESRRVDHTMIRWPSGQTQEWKDLPVDAELLLIEGRPFPLALRSFKMSSE